MASTSFKWLPPLYCNHSQMVATTRMEISQTEPFRPDNSLQDTHLTMSFEARVDFVSDIKDPDKRQDNFLGLAIQECFQGPNLDSIIEEVCRNFRFFEHSITCTEKHYDGDLKTAEEPKMDQQLLLCKVQGFLEEAVEKEYNKGRNEQSLKLKISREIEIPDAWLVSWHSWYAEMAENVPGFEQEWSRDIRRPRTEEERRYQSRLIKVPDLKVELEKTAGESCAICLDEFSVGSRVAKLPCDHIFHRKCITNWSYKGKLGKCPTCRRDIPRKCYSVNYNRLPPSVENKCRKQFPNYDYAFVDRFSMEPDPAIKFSMMMESIRMSGRFPSSSARQERLVKLLRSATSS